ncbi:MAG TPA: GDSL-type esterase/lipase family protein [Chitinophagaceae bacterium]|nr:GDSL-type esterase/lipase family protein [Chitinophagaceae bacterium]
MKRFFLHIIYLTTLFHSPVSAQTIPVNENQFRFYSFVKPSIDQISNSKELAVFYQKLYFLKKEDSGVVSIVHIGDSHIQADYLTSIMRNSLQSFFGNAGRGLVFPYQLAQSNAPPDIGSFSNNTWQFNRVAHPEIPIASGISGYCIQTSDSIASLNLFLKNSGSIGTNSFDHLKIFTNNSDWLLQAANNSSPVLIKKDASDSSVNKEIVFEHPADSFSISSLPSGSLKEFYGASLENSNAGIIYHTIGVNGATYDSYNNAPLFWQQLPALKADLYIISLGTNEAQKIGLDQKVFLQQVSSFLEKLKATSPNAAIIITTPADDFYRRKRPNVMLKQIAASLTNYCNKNKIPLWDLYRITGAYGSAYKWLRKGLMNNDRVHFNNEGYRIQGTLLFNAFAKGYKSYIKSSNQNRK